MHQARPWGALRFFAPTARSCAAMAMVVTPLITYGLPTRDAFVSLR
jgi:hypothetical protein